jgi:hypothetical protein
MPIRAEFRDLYPADWRRISADVRFGQAGGACQRSFRPHGATLRVLPHVRGKPALRFALRACFRYNH